MVDNWLPSFDMTEQIKIDKHIDEHLNTIINDIQSCKKEIQTVTDTDRQAHLEYLENVSKFPEGLFKNLYKVTDDCSQCGICTQVCPAGCISISDNKVVYNMENCQTCMACIHNCPKKAIQLNIPEKNPNARYRNENITLQEIIKSNIQNSAK